jgi:UDP-N-acetylglucosamine 4,6-dehydratase/5-epimerase
MFNNKVILITGGTGSFGKLLADFIIKNYVPKKLIIFSRDELKQSIMAAKYSNSKYGFLRFFIGDVRDLDRLISATQEVDFLIHAAAMKHVNAAEYNPIECVKTNIGGAENIVTASIRSKVKKVIALSTDKASDPINLYGATKLASDKIFVSANNIVGKNPTRFSVVRYGNVAGSRGSIIEIFKTFIQNEEKELPITDERMTRFWITLDQAVNFVIKSFDRMRGGEIFFPMIPSIRITDLAKSMAPNLKHKIIGIRPGEKLHEQMCSKNESHLTLRFKDYFLIKPSIQFFDMKINYNINLEKEKGEAVKNDYEYRSDTNEKFLSVEEIKKLNTKLGF